jgi:hypothetical protein
MLHQSIMSRTAKTDMAADCSRVKEVTRGTMPGEWMRFSGLMA